MSGLRVLDVETYRNYFLVLALDPENGTVYRWEKYNDTERGRPAHELNRMLKTCTTVTFNGLAYDWWMLSGYLKGFTNATLCGLSDWLIKTPMAQWNAQDHWSIPPHPGKHIDIMPVAPLVASLKMYGGRLKAPRLQELPVEPGSTISDAQRDVLIEYCINDLYTTERLRTTLKEQVLLRHRMGKTLGMDLMSKSDAQIAEGVIKHLLQGSGVTPAKSPLFLDGNYVDVTIHYDTPECVSFISNSFKSALKNVQEAPFRLSKSGSPLIPKALRATVKFGNAAYKMGIGGLHSTEKKRSIRIEPGQYLTDLDVTSYYPQLILTQGLYPTHLGPKFLSIYRSLVYQRVDAKQSGNTVKADSLKIVINSSFGKFGSRFSSLYSPKLLLQVTLSGQLYLMMLIEQIELRTDCVVVSANTDGITVFSPDAKQYLRMEKVAAQWMIRTKMGLESVQYSAVHSQDVNNYLAIKTDGSVKRKGLFAGPSLSKNPSFSIVQDAVVELLSVGYPIEQYIRECTDLHRFTALRKVGFGGAIYRDDEVGSTVRWYNSTRGSPIQYRRDGKLVAGARHAALVNDFPDTMPSDVDYQFYIDKAFELIDGVGIAESEYAA